jgi:hypothetical protein
MSARETWWMRLIRVLLPMVIDWICPSCGARKKARPGKAPKCKCGWAMVSSDT